MSKQLRDKYREQRNIEVKYSSDQPRDERGRFASSGSSLSNVTRSNPPDISERNRAETERHPEYEANRSLVESMRSAGVDEQTIRKRLNEHVADKADADHSKMLTPAEIASTNQQAREERDQLIAKLDKEKQNLAINHHRKMAEFHLDTASQFERMGESGLAKSYRSQATAEYDALRRAKEGYF